jgi:hypothetical protein
MIMLARCEQQCAVRSFVGIRLYYSVLLRVLTCTQDFCFYTLLVDFEDGLIADR